MVVGRSRISKMGRSPLGWGNRARRAIVVTESSVRFERATTTRAWTMDGLMPSLLNPMVASPGSARKACGSIGAALVCGLLSAIVGLSCSALPDPGTVRTVHTEGVAHPRDSPWPEDAPIAKVTTHDPWATVIGAELPRASLYDDGTVIRWDVVEGEGTIFTTARLTALELLRVRNALGPIDRLQSMSASYDMSPGARDEPTVEISRRSGREAKTVEVRGYDSERGVNEERSASVQEIHALREFSRLYNLLVELKPQNSVEWRERFLEVMLWPASPEYETVSWPTSWPDLDSEFVFRNGDMISIIVDGRMKAALRRFMRSVKPNEVVSISGRSWIIAFRPVMPGGSVAEQLAAMQAKSNDDGSKPDSRRSK